MSNHMPPAAELSNDRQSPASAPAIRRLYTSACVNRRSGCMSVLPVVVQNNGQSEPLLAFGSSHAVCIARLVRAEHGSTAPGSSRSTVPMFYILRILHGHDAPVNAVRWLNLPNNLTRTQWPYALLLTLDTCGKALVWCCHMDRLSDQEDTAGDWSVLLDLQVPNSFATNAIDGCLIVNDLPSSPDSVLLSLLVDVAADAALYSWRVRIKNTFGALPTALTDDPIVVRRDPSMCLCLRSFCWSLTANDSPLCPQSALHFVVVGLDNGLIEIWSEHVQREPATDSSDPSRKLSQSATLLGHTDWVRCLDICAQPQAPVATVFLASGGQDNMVRIWRLYNRDSQSSPITEDRSTLKVADLRLPETVKLNLAVASESVLSSHENWITGVSWEPDTTNSGFPPALLSSSMDRSLIVWTPPDQQQSGAGDEVRLWLEQIRVGDIGGTGLGFLDCCWILSDTFRAILGQNFQCSVSLWTYERQTDTWLTGLPLCGHSGPVTDLTWSKTPSTPDSDGVGDAHACRYRVLLTAGSDQTVRAHGPRRLHAVDKHHVLDGTNGLENCVWQELARPQVHGYDMNAVASISPVCYASAGDEKVVRVFQATRAFFSAYENSSGSMHPIVEQSLAQGAVQPTLGLSNQVAAGGDADYRSGEPDIDASTSSLTPLPTEDRLKHATLWPEIKKLYGHAYEVYCLAAHPRLLLVASACVATKPTHAFIILWNGYADWAIHSRLMHHQLTVTQMAWSHDGRALLAVSRDRTWSVWAGSESHGNNTADPSALPTYTLVAYPAKGKSHSRIIWTGAWSPDDRYFFTGSRDKTILVWTRPSISNSEVIHPVACVPLDIRKTFADAVTALDVAPLPVTQCSSAYILAVGLESGQIQLFLCRSESGSIAQLSWSDPIPFPVGLCHVNSKRVRRVAFEPSSSVSNFKSMLLTLATAADDGFVHLFQIDSERLPPTL